MYHILCIHSPISGHLDCLYTLAIVSNAAMNVGIQIPVQVCAFNSFWVTLRNTIAESHGLIVFNLSPHKDCQFLRDKDWF